MCQALLTSHGRPSPSRGVDGGHLGGNWDEGREGALWLEYEMNKKFKLKKNTINFHHFMCICISLYGYKCVLVCISANL